MHSPLDNRCSGVILQALVCLFVLVGCDNVPPSAVAHKSSETSQAQSSTVIRFYGICDGSAAVALSNDHLLVAYDEQNSLFEFSSSGGFPLRQHDYGKALGSTSEVDVEAAALLQQAIWWIGSHGNDGSGDRAVSRQQLFRTEVHYSADNQSRVEVAGESIDLLPELLRQGIAAGLFDQSHKKMRPKKGGINIEGMAAMESGHLLIGLRSPLTIGGNAIVARVDISATPPSVVRFYNPDLGKRGVRDIQPFENAYLLIAGDVDSGGDFSIYRWVPESKPVWLLDLPKHFNAEALVKTGEQWLVMSDDGKVKRSDDRAADGDRQCDTIRDKNPLAGQHPSVFFRALVLDRQTLQ